MTVSSDFNTSVVPVPDGTAAKKQPLLVFAAAPATGHTAPVIHIAREMIKRGFGAIFMTSEEFKAPVKDAGAEWFEQAPMLNETLIEAREKTPLGPARVLWDFEHIWLDQLPARAQRLKSLLEMVREREPDRTVIIVAETMSLAALPFRLGAPLPKGYTKFPKVVCINIVPLVLSSIDTAPFGVGLPPDSTDSGRARNKVLYDLMYGVPFAGLMTQYKAVLTKLGCTGIPDKFMFDAMLESYDTTLQMCSPSLEYPRSDLHPSIRFAGALPHRGINPKHVFPDWWNAIVANSALPAGHPDKKKVVPIAQGTVATDYDQLILPALEGLAYRSDIIAIAILGVKDAKLPEGYTIPANARVVDYLPYDAALAHADVFVTNAGYGGMMHGVINGVPMVVAGITEDKVEVSARVEWAGFGVNLRTQTPSKEAVAEAVARVLGDLKYKAKAERLRKENEDLDSLSIIERQIRAYAKES